MKQPAFGAIAAGVLAAAVGSTAWGSWNLPVRPVSVQLGLRLVETTAQLRSTLGVTAERGALVLEVEPGGPAERAGLRAGDVVTRVAKKAVGTADDVLGALEERRPGETVPVEFVRGGAIETASVKLVRAREPGVRIDGWTIPLPGRQTPEEMQGDVRRFRERVERRLRELERRLRHLEEHTPTERT